MDHRTKASFRGRARFVLRRGEIPSDVVDAAIEEALEEGWWQESGAPRRALERAKAIWEEWTEAEEAPVEETPLQRERSRHLQELVRPSVEGVREELFGSPDAPFETYEEAITWIEAAEAVRWLDADGPEVDPVSETDAERAAELIGELDDLAAELRRVHRTEVEVSLSRPTLRYPAPDGGGIRRAWVLPESSLGELAAFSTKVADQVGIAAPSLVAHVLAGTGFMAPRVTMEGRVDRRYTLPDGTGWVRRAVPITVHEPLRWDDLRKLRPWLRALWRGATPREMLATKVDFGDDGHGPTLTEAEEEVLEVNRALGGDWSERADATFGELAEKAAELGFRKRTRKGEGDRLTEQAMSARWRSFEEKRDQLAPFLPDVPHED